MSWFGGIKLASKGLLTGVKWQLWAWKLGLALVLLGSAYGAGVLRTKHSYAVAEAQRASVRAEQVVKVVEKRIPVIQVQEKVRTEVEYKTQYVKEKLNEELAKNPARPQCALSAIELQYYREIAEQTRVRTE